MNRSRLPSPKLESQPNSLLRLKLGPSRKTLSWAIQGGGFQISDEIIWLQVKNSDLTVDVCPREFVKARVENSRSLVFLTSASLESYQEVRVERDGVEVIAVATTGLGNALRAGDEVGPYPASRTINLACLINQRLSDNAQLEALSIMTEAKTAAILEGGVISRQSGLRATGTGTDCQAIATAETGPVHDYAGKHTLIGSLIGRASLEVIRLGVLAWNDLQTAAK